MNFNDLSIVFLILSLLALWGWKKNLEAFKLQLKVTEPELWEKFEKPCAAYADASPDRQLQEYIWQREYLELNDSDLLHKAKAARFYHLTFAVNTTFLLISCAAQFFLSRI